MVELTYLDSYKVKRTLTYDDFDEFLLAFSGCVTVPDSLKVLSIPYNGHQLPFTGLIGYNITKNSTLFFFSESNTLN